MLGGDNTRIPGDVGLAQRHVLIPLRDNIHLTQGVQPTRFGGVPKGFLARLAREAQGTKAPKRSGTQSRWGVYFGEITLHGQKRLAYIVRLPPVATSKSVYVPRREGGMGRIGRRMRDINHPRITQIMAEQLADILAHAAKWDCPGLVDG